MATDLFDQLSVGEIPSPPPQFEQRVHERLNRNLLMQQTLDFVLGAAPWLGVHLLSAGWGVLHFTLMGRYPKGGDGNQPNGERESAP